MISTKALTAKKERMSYRSSTLLSWPTMEIDARDLYLHVKSQVGVLKNQSVEIFTVIFTIPR